MQNSSPLSGIGKVDFFAVLPAGFYIFLVIYLVFLNDGNSEPTNIWEQIKSLAKDMKENPILVLFILFASYLLGSIIRTIPVDWADSIVPPYKSKFPYLDKLEETYSFLEKNAEMVLINPKIMPQFHKDKEKMRLFLNYCKCPLCMYAPQSFVYYETFEARSRLFVGIFWAGILGVIGFLIMLIRVWNFTFIPAWHLFFMSTALVIPFGLSIKRVRRQEVNTLWSSYIAYLQKNEQIKNTPDE